MTRLADGRRNPTYLVWRTMKDRCLNSKSKNFARYGGRGIKVCRRWMTFANFLADMGPRPPGATLDRYPNNNGDYEPGNCRWATRKENSRNRSDNRLLTFNGQTRTLAEWVETSGLSLATLQGRLRMGWTDEQILATPVRTRSPNSMLTVNGTTKPLADWCRERGLSTRTVRHRLTKQGLSPEQALQP
jgi:hypothetical protein